ncbi:hypothetical protein FYM52_17710 [Comamonas sp. CAH-2]|uniref:hypothetical protein n=1 Tax=Comamonas sp. CAH-2 TaxID=2605745 RepID=UPI0012AD8520|nr:hypothetical protein [Comamonas sp. CAH-2]MRT22171.1 hypothetical protein [Comamonas sp. CAH-2]
MENFEMHGMERLKKYFQSTHPCAQPAECMRLWISKKYSPGGLKNLSTFWHVELSTACVQMEAACCGAGIQTHHTELTDSTLRRERLICCKNYFLPISMMAMICNFVYLF